jgi:hypothetical protein
MGLPAAEAEHRASEARREAARGAFREHVRTVAIRASVRSEALGYVAHQAEEVFGYHPDTGTFLPKTGHYDPWDPVRDLTVETWLRRLKETDPQLFEPAAAPRFRLAD